mgnify:CR=1 FL=1
MLLYLDAQNGITPDENVSIGVFTKTAVFPGEVVKKALNHQATAHIIFTTNPHPAPSPVMQISF